MVSLGKIPAYQSLKLGPLFNEQVGLLAHDRARPHHALTLNGTPPTWEVLPSGFQCLRFDGANDYLDAPAADTTDLNFTLQDYTLAAWINWENGQDSQVVMGRYEVDVSGWELYLYQDPSWYLTLRQHHAGGAAIRTACYSGGWVQNTWHFMCVTKSGPSAQFYRNGVALEATCNGGLTDPETCDRDLVLGIRFTKDANWYKGFMGSPRVWDRALSVREIRMLFNCERSWVGV